LRNRSGPQRVARRVPVGIPTTLRKAGDEPSKFEERCQFAAAMIGALIVDKTVGKPILTERNVSPWVEMSGRC
jgi:hypothetical protein